MSPFASATGGVSWSLGEDNKASSEESSVRASRSQSVPGRIMAPRLIFAGVSLALVLFGLVMIYSASSIMGLTSKYYDHNAAYFLIRQGLLAGVGVIFCVVLAWVDYHKWRGVLLNVIWAVTVLSLLVVYTPIAGQDAYGASRWIAIGSFRLQPSEFAKVTVLLVGARVAEGYYGTCTMDRNAFIKHSLIGIVLPLALILKQPDKGTTGVLLLSLLVMVYLSGVSGKIIAVIAGAGVIVALLYALKDDYSRARILTMLDPFSDEYGAGYQLTQGFYALGSGGLTGVGLGLSRQKYNYLPMAHNDFIFAIVGEELGFVGAVLLLASFAVLLWAGLKIAEHAPDLMGRLIAAGCTSLLVIQLLLNVSGVVGIFPLSGKPVPFISYGGSSIISSLMLVGLVLSVSFRSKLPETGYDRRRAALRLAEEDERGERDARDTDGSYVGDVMPRSARLASSRTTARRVAATRGVDQDHPSRPPMLLIEGGRSRSRTNGRRSRDASTNHERVDLGPSPAERLRGSGRGDGHSR